jgi:hypothetical protein
MAEMETKSVDEASVQMIEKAAADGVETVFDRGRGELLQALWDGTLSGSGSKKRGCRETHRGLRGHSRNDFGEKLRPHGGGWSRGPWGSRPGCG